LFAHLPRKMKRSQFRIRVRGCTIKNVFGKVAKVGMVFMLAIQVLYSIYGLIVWLGRLEDNMNSIGLVWPLSMLLFNLLHCFYVLGWLLALVFFSIVVVIGYLFEVIAIATGELSYSGYKTVKVSGVPLDLLLSWFIIVYPCYTIACLMMNHVNRTETHIRRPNVLYMLTLAILTALVATSIDLILEPLTSALYAKWKDTDGIFFGVPAVNFICWMFAVSLSIALFLVAEIYLSFAVNKMTIPPYIRLLPLFSLVMLMVVLGAVARPPGLGLVAIIVTVWVFTIPLTRMYHAMCDIRKERENINYHD